MALHSLKKSAPYDVEVFCNISFCLKFWEAASHIRMEKKEMYFPKQNIASLSSIRQACIHIFQNQGCFCKTYFLWACSLLQPQCLECPIPSPHFMLAGNQGLLSHRTSQLTREWQKTYFTLWFVSLQLRK